MQRLDKVLQDGIKLTSVASQTLGVSAPAMLDALVEGTRDPEVLTDLARGRLRDKLPALHEVLKGHFRAEHHGVVLAQTLAHIDFLMRRWLTVGSHREEAIAPFSDKAVGTEQGPRLDEEVGSRPHH